MSPGRTGSLLILSFLSNVAKVTPIVRYDTDNIGPLKPKEILHSHTPEDVHLANQDTFFILSTRNLIDCTYSRIIGRHTNRWRYYQNRGTVNPFTITIEDYLSAYNFTVNYYKALKPILPNSILRIDYNEFADDSTKLIKILNLPEISYKFANKSHIPTKTPGTYQTWIINYDEINEFAQTLDPIPPI